MKTSDPIYIIGAGAIGKALAVFLQLNQQHVVLIRASVDDGSDHAENIQVELTDERMVAAEVEISTLSKFSHFKGIVVLTSKSFGNEHIAAAIQEKMQDSPLVILQNGLHIEQPFIDAGFKKIYRCVLFASSQAFSPNLLRFKPATVSPIGAITGNKEELDFIARQLNNPYFEFRAEDAIEPVIWTKAIVNCVFNSVCPLIETDNGIFHRNSAALAIAERIITECVAVAALKGVHLRIEAVMDRLLMISKSSDGQLISTFQDMKNKRRTEIETFNFAIASVAGQMKRPEIVKETNLLGELTKLKSVLHL